jgi:hypothetical protein
MGDRDLVNWLKANYREQDVKPFSIIDGNEHALGFWFWNARLDRHEKVGLKELVDLFGPDFRTFTGNCVIVKFKWRDIINL